MATMMNTTTDTGRAIRLALAEKAENGNRSFVKRDDVKAHGGLDTQWTEYNDTLIKMEAEARKFVLHYYGVLEGKDPASLDAKAIERDAELNRINDKLISLKKDLLKWVDPEQKHRCSFCDGIIIGEMAHDILAQKNNTEGEREFKSRSSHSYASRAVFRHKLEAYLGILITGADVIEPEKANYLRVERKLLGKINAAKRKEQEARDKRAQFVAFAAEYGIDEKAQKARLTELDTNIDGLVSAVKKAETEFNKFRADHRNKKLAEDSIEVILGEQKKEEIKAEATKKVEDMTVEELKKVLDEAKVKYPKKPKKAELQELVVNLMTKDAEQAESEPEQPEATEKVAEPEQATAEAK